MGRPEEAAASPRGALPGGDMEGGTWVGSSGKGRTGFISQCAGTLLVL